MHFSRIEIKNHGRGMIAKEAYRAALRAHDGYLGKTVDYSSRSDVVVSKIIYPPGIQDVYLTALDFWEAAEAEEKRKDARVAKEFLVSLPRELSTELQIKAIEAFIHQQFTSKSLVATYSLHSPPASDGEKNPHAHILVATRPKHPSGFAAKKCRDFDGRSGVLQARSAWDDILDLYLNHANRKNVKRTLSETKQKALVNDLLTLEHLLRAGTIHIPALSKRKEQKNIKSSSAKQHSWGR